MKIRINKIVSLNIALALCLFCICLCTTDDGEIEQSFQNPPQSAYPHTWYHWMNGNISKEGITKDLESFKEVGIGGFQLFDINWQMPFGGIEYNSPEHHECIAHTIAEADRLGLEMGINSASGWSCTGGPWVKPENSMKMLVWSETEVIEGENEIVLPKPELNKKQKAYNYYHDIAVLAFPTPQNSAYRLHEWDKKSLNDLRSHADQYIPVSEEAPKNAVIAKKSIRNLSDQLDDQGKLNWNPPTGNWTILRIGYTTTASTLRPGSKGGQGLEIDKMSRRAVDLHWQELLNKVVVDANGKKALTTILIDSYEVGNQNWTPGFEMLFQQQKGFDLIPNLIAMTGRIVESTNYTERVLWDMRTTVAKLVETNFYEYFKSKCQKHGLLLAAEPYGTGSFDATAVAKVADLPMTEFWHKDDPWKRRNIWDWTAQIVPSAARLTGKKVVGAESFTQMQGNWLAHPYRMKIWGDRAFCFGTNRYYIHSSVHQPWNDAVKPGNTMGMFGTQFHRNNTWFYQSKAWLEYVARCQYILQTGIYVSDFLVLYGDERGFNNFLANKEPLDMEFLSGFRFDLSGIETLDQLSVNKHGEILVTHDGVLLPNRYQMILLKRSGLMTIETAYKLGDLAENGATIFAPQPIRTPGLNNYQEHDKRLDDLIKKYWDSGLIKTPDQYKPKLNSLIPDCNLPEQMQFCHHKIKDGDFYFVSNQSYDTREIKAVFRVVGKQPELWNPETGEIWNAPNWRQTDDGRTEVSLEMTPAGSVFVVFRNKTNKKDHSEPQPESKIVCRVDTPWKVHFDPDYGPSEAIVFNELIPLNEHQDEVVQHYSGTATYKTKFSLKEKGGEMVLDLGQVEVIAEVELNGKNLGILWKPPFKVDVSDVVKEGENDLVVKVTNLWPNRLIGDAKYPAFQGRSGKSGKPGNNFKKYPDWLTSGEQIPEDSQRSTFVAWHHYKNPKAKLLPSGLIGPVVITEYK